MSKAREALGMHPAKGVFVAFLALTGIAIIAGIILMSAGGRAGAMFVVLLFAGWVVLSLLGLLFLASALKHGRTYRAARQAIEGGLEPSYAGVGFLSEGIFVVDENSKRIFVNDGIYPFSAVKQISTNDDGKWILIEMSSGAQPLKIIKIGSAEEARNLYTRLSNSLDFD